MLRVAQTIRGCVPLAGILVATEAFADLSVHAYPQSCFADGLPLGQVARDPHGQSLPLSLHGDFNACFVNPVAPNYAASQVECHYSEAVTISAFRVPCSGGTSATLLEIDRPTNMQGNTSSYPTFPGVWVQQQNLIGYIRLAADPNTTNSQMYVNGPVYRSSIYTLENTIGAPAFDYNHAFTLTVDNNTGYAVQFDFATYDPADYPAAAQGMPISGYLTGSWYDPTHGGEGILTEVLDNGDGATRTFVATWYTFDALGAPYWLIAQGGFAIGATHIDNVPVQYDSNGGFAGAFSAVSRNPWGTMSVSFADCSHLHFSYASSTSASGVPTGSGTRDWVRIGNLQALSCN
jgi:hypothetical protein